jgi:ubiquinone/menaquinone biosynthesis C-methylase UbiE
VVKRVIKRLLMKSLAKLSRRPKVKVSLERLEGFIVDIGAGGEGIIAKTCGRDAVCLDISKREIDEARSRGAVAHWVLGDACSMPFRNSSFDAATFFFSLMYIKTLERKRAVLVEAKRVLKSDGLLYLWDAIIGEKPDLHVVFVDASLPDGEKVFTGYGVRGNGKEQTLELLIRLALEAGFKIDRTESHKDWFTVGFS